MNEGQFLTYIAPRKVRIWSRFLVFGIFFVGMLGYFAYQAQDLVVGPKLEVIAPGDGVLVETESVRGEGISEPGVELTVNGAKVYSAQDGHFSQELLLARGLHVLEIMARDRFGNEKKVTRQIVVK
ncbi:MAG: hypothetical protein A3C84_02680 [Candidatus Ryanbacteria bacterium RIFCSPHIGHO2_02_FULL_48_12]|nr:MAG: hypothetical protein A3C84_02680 [Candidatus Ryanbacteria bacterium RIFCSPHIGHO2_02_FULL_48_12]